MAAKTTLPRMRKAKLRCRKLGASSVRRFQAAPEKSSARRPVTIKLSQHSPVSQFLIQMVEKIKGISFLAVLAVVLSVLLWFVARAIAPPAFDPQETALLFFACFLMTSFGAWLIKVLRRPSRRKK